MSTTPERRVADAASDYVLGLENSEFAEREGGIDLLEVSLMREIEAWGPVPQGGAAADTLDSQVARAASEYLRGVGDREYAASRGGGALLWSQLQRKLKAWGETCGDTPPTGGGTVADTLHDRESRYGSFMEQAELTQNIKRAMADSENWGQLSDDKRLALEMIALKIGRILNGDPEYADSWHDVAGFATLVERTILVGQERGRNR